MGSSILFSQHSAGLTASLLTLVPLCSEVQQANKNKAKNQQQLNS